MQTKRGYSFESETDTETIAKLVKHIYTQNPALSFRAIVEKAIQQLVSNPHLPVLRGKVAALLKSVIFVFVCSGRSLCAGVQESTLSRRSGCNAVSEYSVFQNKYRTGTDVCGII